MDNKKKEVKDEHELIRLNKFLSDAGVCSRREGDRLIEAGKVVVNGKVALMGQKVTINDDIVVNGEAYGQRKKGEEREQRIWRTAERDHSRSEKACHYPGCFS